MPSGGSRKHPDGCACGKCPKVGRKPKPKIELRANSGIASTVLAEIDEKAYWKRLLRADLTEVEFLALPLNERRLVEETMEYLTNKRDGKPAQGVFVGDTRESARELDFGDLPELIAPGFAQPAGKPN